jgi:hypothetical protein
MTIPDSVKAGLYTALWTFLGSLLVLTQGLVDEGVVPNWETVKKGVVAAFIAAFSGIISTVVRFTQAKTGLGETPSYSKNV